MGLWVREDFSPKNTHIPKNRLKRELFNCDTVGFDLNVIL